MLYRQLRNSFQEDVVRDVLTSTEAQTSLEQEFEQLKKDRNTMREIFPSGNSKVYKYHHAFYFTVSAYYNV